MVNGLCKAFDVTLTVKVFVSCLGIAKVFDTCIVAF